MAGYVTSNMARPCPLKRKRSASLPLTPPLSLTDPEGPRLLDRAVHVLSTAATALSQVSLLYQNDPPTRESFLRAVEVITGVHEAGGKLIICGVGKSGLVGRKIVATMKSLGLASSFLHASEALHGDLGDVRKLDAIMFISYSGKTPELLGLLQHVSKDIPVLAIASQHCAEDCLLLVDRPDAILLPAPIHESEEESFGICAPTTSTTVAIAVGDMLALTVAEATHREDTKDIFRLNHPGGAIGAKHAIVQRDADVGSDDSAPPKRPRI